KAGIRQDALKDSGEAEAKDAPVVAGGSAPASFPSIHPFTAIGEFAVDEDRLGLFQQVFLGSEELVVRGDCSTAKAGGGEVRKVREVRHRCPRRRTRPCGEPIRFPLSKMSCPLRNVLSTMPVSSCPEYGVSLCRW